MSERERACCSMLQRVVSAQSITRNTHQSPTRNHPEEYDQETPSRARPGNTQAEYDQDDTQKNTTRKHPAEHDQSITRAPPEYHQRATRARGRTARGRTARGRMTQVPLDVSSLMPLHSAEGACQWGLT